MYCVVIVNDWTSVVPSHWTKNYLDHLILMRQPRRLKLLRWTFFKTMTMVFNIFLEYNAIAKQKANQAMFYNEVDDSSNEVSQPKQSLSKTKRPMPKSTLYQTSNENLPMTSNSDKSNKLSINNGLTDTACSSSCAISYKDNFNIPRSNSNRRSKKRNLQDITNNSRKIIDEDQENNIVDDIKNGEDCK